MGQCTASGFLIRCHQVCVDLTARGLVIESRVSYGGRASTSLSYCLSAPVVWQ